MRVKNMEMALTPSAMAKLLEIGFDKEYGARPLRRAITSVVDDNLSEALLRGAIEEGDTAVIDYDPGYADGPDPVSARGGFVSPVSAMTTKPGSEQPENVYLGVSVTGVAGDPASAGIETAFCSYGADFSEADEEIFKTAIRGNVVARGGSNVTNDVTA
jgi:ATP-dependent Clp protease ATP-binding subunit ClpC